MMLAAFQLFLDRGQNNDWFSSPEIVIEATVAALALLLFAFHSFTADKPFIPVELLQDRNFVTATCLGLLIGLLVFSVMALLPPMTQTVNSRKSVPPFALKVSPLGAGVCSRPAA